MVNRKIEDDLRKSGVTIDWGNEIRFCSKCGEARSFEYFHWDTRRDLPRSVCKDCRSTDSKIWYKENKEEASARAREYYRKKAKKEKVKKDPRIKGCKNRDQYKKYKNDLTK